MLILGTSESLASPSLTVITLRDGPMGDDEDRFGVVLNSYPNSPWKDPCVQGVNFDRISPISHRRLTGQMHVYPGSSVGLFRVPRAST